MQGKPYLKILFKRQDGTGVKLIWQRPGDMIDIFKLPDDELLSSYSPNLFEEAFEEFKERVEGKVWE